MLALNRVSNFITLGLSTHGIQVVCSHTGGIKTDMTNHIGLIDVETSVAGLGAVIDNIDTHPLSALMPLDGAPIAP